MLAIVVVASVLRLHGLDRTSIWNDEAASWNMARHPFWTMISEQSGDNNPPLFDIILYAMIHLFGDSETILRLPSAILGIANVYLLYRLGTVLWDRLTGVFAAALLTVSGFHLWYSQEARMYALFAAMATAFALASVLFVTAPGRTRAVVCGIAGVALLYSHTYGPLVWVAIDGVIAMALLTRADWIAVDGRTWLIIQGLVGLSFLPWIAALVGEVHQVMQGFWIPFPTPDFLYWTFRSMAGGAAMLGCLGTSHSAFLLAGGRGREIAHRTVYTVRILATPSNHTWVAEYFAALLGTRPLPCRVFCVGRRPASHCQ